MSTLKDSFYSLPWPCIDVVLHVLQLAAICALAYKTLF